MRRLVPALGLSLAFASGCTLLLTDGGDGDGDGDAELTALPTAIDFNQVDIGKSSGAATVTFVALADTGPLEPVLEGQDVFQLSALTCEGSLAKGASCSVDVAFAPIDSGLIKGTLRLGKAAVALTGEGLTPGDLSFDPPSLSFSPTALGSASTPVSIDLTTVGTIPKEVALTVGEGFSVDPTSCMVTAATPCSAQVTFQPASAQGKTILGSLVATPTDESGPTAASLHGGVTVTLTLLLGGDGGTVTVAPESLNGINPSCGSESGQCPVYIFDAATSVTLTMAPPKRWQGACSDIEDANDPCVLRMDDDKSVNVEFGGSN